MAANRGKCFGFWNRLAVGLAREAGWLVDVDHTWTNAYLASVAKCRTQAYRMAEEPFDANPRPGMLDALPEPINVAGAPVTPFESYEQILACIDKTIEGGRRTSWVTINPQKCVRAWQEQQLLDVLNQADAGICGSVGVWIAAKVLYGRWIRRISGYDLFLRLIGHAAHRGWGIFMLGGSPESNALATENLRRRFPGLRIVGCQDGYFADSESVIDRINASRADLLFVAMGSPTQEHWMHRYRKKIDAPFCMGVGSGVDVASSMFKRAPAVFRKIGMEWLFQLLAEPHRSFRRRTIVIPFMLRVLSKKLASKGLEGVDDNPVKSPGWLRVADLEWWD